MLLSLVNVLGWGKEGQQEQLRGQRAHQLIGKHLPVTLAWPAEEIGFPVDKQVPGAASKPQSFIHCGRLFPLVPVTYQAFTTLILQSGC